MATSPAPSTPKGSSSPPSSTPATSVDKNASTNSPKQNGDKLMTETEILTLDDSSSDVEMKDASDKEEQDEGKKGKAKKDEGKKRKGSDSPSAPASKKSKSSSTSSSSTSKKPSAPKPKKDEAAAKSKKGGKDDGAAKKELGNATLNLKMAKLDIKQKALDVKMTPTWNDELAAFVQYATKLFNGTLDEDDNEEASESEEDEDETDKKKTKKAKTKSKSAKGKKGKKKDVLLDEWPEEHYGLIVKLVHESSATLASVAGFVRKELVNAIENAKMLLDTEEDSQEKEDEGMSVKDRLPIAPLKALISTVATRQNYGLTPALLASLTPPVEADEVPDKLAYWCWEVKEEKMDGLEEVLGEKGEGLRGMWEKRRGEREQAQKDALTLFAALTPEQQSALLAGTASASASASASKSTSSASGDKKGKGKATFPTSDAAVEEGEGDDEGESKKVKPAAKEKKEKVKKELTEEQKKEAEEKARLKAEKEAEKEAKRKERDEKKAEKEEKKAEKERVKREKEEEEERKEKIKKKQANAFLGFFKTSPVPEAGPSKSSSTPQKAASPSLASASGKTPTASTSSTPADAKPSTAAKKEKGFDAVFFPFKVRERVEVAEVCWDAERRGKVAEGVEVKEEGEMSRDALLTSLRSRRPRIRLSNLSHYPSPPVTVRSAVDAITDANLTNNDVSQYYDLLNDRSKVAVKLLKFREDVRPGYVGTWTKTSRVVGFRTPFAKESALLNYDYDSEAEWEEEPEGEGEDVLSDGEEEKDDPGAASEADSWLAEDDEIEYEEGYDEGDDVVMLDAEGRGRGTKMDVDSDVEIVEDEAEKKRRKKAAEKKRKEAEERQKKRKVALASRPVIKGLAWDDEQGKSTEPLFKAMKVQFLNDASFGLNPFTFVSKPFASTSSATASAATNPGKGKENVVPPSSSAAAASSAADGKPSLAPVPAGQVNVLKAKKGAPAKPFPAEHLGRFVKLVNGSDKTKVILVDDFFRTLKAEGVQVTKGAVEAKFAEITGKRVKNKQVVKEEVLTQLGIAVSA